MTGFKMSGVCSMKVLVGSGVGITISPFFFAVDTSGAAGGAVKFLGLALQSLGRFGALTLFRWLEQANDKHYGCHGQLS